MLKGINTASDQREMWNRIKNLAKKKIFFFNVVLEGIEYTKNVEIVERFNEYFINSIRDICNSIEKVNYENNVKISNHRLNFREISLMELENICRNMKKKRD